MMEQHCWWQVKEVEDPRKCVTDNASMLIGPNSPTLSLNVRQINVQAILLPLRHSHQSAGLRTPFIVRTATPGERHSSLSR